MFQKLNSMMMDMIEKFVEPINTTIETKLQAMQNELFEMAKECPNMFYNISV